MTAAVVTAIALVAMAGPLPRHASAGAAPAAELTVAITSPSPDAVVTGVVTVVAEASEGTVELAFAVSTDGGATWTPIATDATAADGWTTRWDSGNYSGRAVLRADASDAASRASGEVRIVVDNAAPKLSLVLSRRVFSPNNDARKDTTTLKMSSNEPAVLTLEVLGRKGGVRRRWHTSGMQAREVVEWGGTAAGRRLADGRYKLRAEARDAVGLRTHTTKPVVIDTRAPQIGSFRIGPTLFTRAGILESRYRLRDRSRQFNVRLQIADRVGTVRNVERRGGRYGKILYRTRYRNGRPLYPGLYSTRLRVADDAGNVALSRQMSWRMHRPVKARVVRRLENVGRRVALTFDDCNYSDAWRRILRVLATWKIKATFFCSGEQVTWNREVARKTADDGHAIGSHGWDHALLSGRPRSDIEWRIRADARLWWEIARSTPAPLYRPAYGGYDRDVVAAAGAMGYGRIVMWDVDSLDFRTSSPSAIAGRVLSDVRPGSIVLLHVLPQTADALPAILRGLVQRRLQPIDLPRFFHAGGYR